MRYLETKHEKNSAKITGLILLIIALLLFVVGPPYDEIPEEYGVAINFGDGGEISDANPNSAAQSQPDTDDNQPVETLEEELPEDISEEDIPEEKLEEQLEDKAEELAAEELAKEIAEQEQKAAAEEQRIAEEKAAEELLAQQEAEALKIKEAEEAKKKEEAEKANKERLEKERIEKEKAAEAKAKAKAAAEAKAKADKIAKEKAEKAAKAKVEREAKARAEKAARDKAAREAKAEADRKAAAAKAAAAKAEADRKAAAAAKGKSGGGEVVGFNLVEKMPTYPGCEGGDNAYKKKCMNEKLQGFVSKNFDKSIASNIGLKGSQKITIYFKIDASGKVIDISPRAADPKLKAEARRVAKLLPRLKPGIQQGKAVIVPYSVSIRFQAKE